MYYWQTVLDKTWGSDEWSYRYRATDVLITISGPPCLHLVTEITDMCGPLHYQVLPLQANWLIMK